MGDFVGEIDERTDGIREGTLLGVIDGFFEIEGDVDVGDTDGASLCG